MFLSHTGERIRPYEILDHPPQYARITTRPGEAIRQKPIAIGDIEPYTNIKVLGQFNGFARRQTVDEFHLAGRACFPEAFDGFLGQPSIMTGYGYEARTACEAINDVQETRPHINVRSTGIDPLSFYNPDRKTMFNGPICILRTSTPTARQRVREIIIQWK